MEIMSQNTPFALMPVPWIANSTIICFDFLKLNIVFDCNNCYKRMPMARISQAALNGSETAHPNRPIHCVGQWSVLGGYCFYIRKSVFVMHDFHSLWMPSRRIQERFISDRHFGRLWAYGKWSLGRVFRCSFSISILFVRLCCNAHERARISRNTIKQKRRGQCTRQSIRYDLQGLLMLMPMCAVVCCVKYILRLFSSHSSYVC